MVKIHHRDGTTTDYGHRGSAALEALRSGSGSSNTPTTQTTTETEIAKEKLRKNTRFNANVNSLMRAGYPRREAEDLAAKYFHQTNVSIGKGLSNAPSNYEKSGTRKLRSFNEAHTKPSTYNPNLSNVERGIESLAIKYKNGELSKKTYLQKVADKIRTYDSRTQNALLKYSNTAAAVFGEARYHAAGFVESFSMLEFIPAGSKYAIEHPDTILPSTKLYKDAIIEGTIQSFHDNPRRATINLIACIALPFVKVRGAKLPTPKTVIRNMSQVPKVTAKSWKSPKLKTAVIREYNTIERTTAKNLTSLSRKYSSVLKKASSSRSSKTRSNARIELKRIEGDMVSTLYEKRNAVLNMKRIERAYKNKPYSKQTVADMRYDLNSYLNPNVVRKGTKAYGKRMAEMSKEAKANRKLNKKTKILTNKISPRRKKTTSKTRTKKGTGKMKSQKEFTRKMNKASMKYKRSTPRKKTTTNKKPTTKKKTTTTYTFKASSKPSKKGTSTAGRSSKSCTSMYCKAGSVKRSSPSTGPTPQLQKAAATANRKVGLKTAEYKTVEEALGIKFELPKVKTEVSTQVKTATQTANRAKTASKGVTKTKLKTATQIRTKKAVLLALATQLKTNIKALTATQTQLKTIVKTVTRVKPVTKTARARKTAVSTSTKTMGSTVTKAIAQQKTALKAVTTSINKVPALPPTVKPSLKIPTKKKTGKGGKKNKRYTKKVITNKVATFNELFGIESKKKPTPRKKTTTNKKPTTSKKRVPAKKKSGGRRK